MNTMTIVTSMTDDHKPVVKNINAITGEPELSDSVWVINNDDGIMNYLCQYHAMQLVNSLSLPVVINNCQYGSVNAQGEPGYTGVEIYSVPSWDRGESDSPVSCSELDCEVYLDVPLTEYGRSNPEGNTFPDFVMRELNMEGSN